jgi:isopentenyl-diphosphate delta-isomerase
MTSAPPRRNVADPGSAEEIGARKAEHLEVAVGDVEARIPAGWMDVELIHDSLPEIDLDDVDTSVDFLGRRCEAPFVIASMTGGHPKAREINACLARAAQRHGIPMGVGSQRAALRMPSVAHTYEVARAEAPDAFLIGNIGAPQLIDQSSTEQALPIADVEAAVEMIEADAMAVHLNFTEEMVQPEGNRRARGCLAAIAEVAAELGGRTPVIGKETGSGMSPAVARRLVDAGVSALDVGGRGGTSFAKVEAQRAAERGDRRRARLGDLLGDWGVPTPVSVVAAARAGAPVVATGGVRSGIDSAKALALGATMVGVARPMLQAALEGEEAIDTVIEDFVAELRVAMFLTGSRTVSDLRTASAIVLGRTHDWMRSIVPEFRHE